MTSHKRASNNGANVIREENELKASLDIPADHRLTVKLNINIALSVLVCYQRLKRPLRFTINVTFWN